MRSIVILVGTLLSSSVFAADTKSFDPPSAAVCVDSEVKSANTTALNGNVWVVDKIKLATWALNNYAISREPEDWAASHPNGAAFPGVPPRVEVIADENFCKGKTNPSGRFDCKSDDKNAIDQARLGLLSWLGGPAKEFDNSGIPAGRQEEFFSDPTLQIKCIGVTDTTKPPPPAGTFVHLRVRGSTDVLRYDQKSPEFKSVPNASLAINRDDVNNKTTIKVVGVIGYQVFNTSDTSNSFEVVPYFGINRNVSSAARKGTTTTANTRDIGLSIDASHVTRGDKTTDAYVDNVFLVRPDYLSDLQHHSHILSLNVSYTPIVTKLINFYFPIIPGKEHFASIMPLFDVRLDSGHYQDCGSLQPHQCFNYTRLGSQFGFAITSDNENLPFNLSVTDTRLAGLTKRSRDIDYLKAVLSYALNKDKSVALDLGFSDGRREDTAIEEKLWSLSLGVKY